MPSMYRNTYIYIYIRGVKLHVHVDVRGEEPLTAYTYSKRFTGGGCTHNTGQRYILLYIYIYIYTCRLMEITGCGWPIHFCSNPSVEGSVCVCVRSQCIQRGCLQACMMWRQSHLAPTEGLA